MPLIQFHSPTLTVNTNLLVGQVEDLEVVMLNKHLPKGLIESSRKCSEVAFTTLHWEGATGKHYCEIFDGSVAQERKSELKASDDV